MRAWVKTNNATQLPVHTRRKVYVALSHFRGMNGTGIMLADEARC